MQGGVGWCWGRAQAQLHDNASGRGRLADSACVFPERRGPVQVSARNRDASSARMCGTASSGRPAGPPWMSASTESASAMTSSGVTFSSGSSYSACTADWSMLSAAKSTKTLAASVCRLACASMPVAGMRCFCCCAVCQSWLCSKLDDERGSDDLLEVGNREHAAKKVDIKWLRGADRLLDQLPGTRFALPASKCNIHL